MPVEIASTIEELNEALPAVDDPKSEGDDHFRLLKRVLKFCFGKIGGAVELTHDEINELPDRIDELDGASVKKRIAGTLPIVDFGGHVGAFSGYSPTGSDFHVPCIKWVKDYVDDVVKVRLHPVGSLVTYYNNPTNPSAVLGFGTWTPFAQGRVIVGVGGGTDTRGETIVFPAASTGGEYKHQITPDELAAHTHPFTDNSGALGGGSGIESGGDAGVTSPGTSDTTGSAGSDQPHNNIQPYITAYIWRRTA